MREYLVFRLYAPLSSWGDIAVGEVRPSWPYPTRSAVLGLLAAAKGIRREHRDDLDKLRSGYAVAVRILTAGTPLRDYHTIQRPERSTIGRSRNAPVKTYATRREELADRGPIINCTQSTRDYYMDAIHDVAVWAAASPPPWPLAELRAQLEHPEFCLYLGRKSCPPALPLHPQVYASTTLREAFAKAVFPDGELLKPVLKEERLVQVYWDESLKEEHGYKEVHRVTRRDDPLDRERWQFLERQECYATETREDEACS